MAIAFQVTRTGEGFHGHTTRSLDDTIEVLVRRLDKVIGPYHFRGEEKKEFTRRQLVERLKTRGKAMEVGDRLIVVGAGTAQLTLCLRKWEIPATKDESPLITWAKRFVGKSPYRLGALGPPGDSDCSGLTLKAVKETFGPSLPHMADLQMRDERLYRFTDESNLRSGDFVFLNYGRLEPGKADHVEFFVKPGKTLGSRPSTHGVGYYAFGAYDATRVLRYGRLKKQFTGS